MSYDRPKSGIQFLVAHFTVVQRCIAIVGIPDKAQFPAFKLPVQLIRIHIAQRW